MWLLPLPGVPILPFYPKVTQVTFSFFKVLRSRLLQEACVCFYLHCIELNQIIDLSPQETVYSSTVHSAWYTAVLNKCLCTWPVSWMTESNGKKIKPSLQRRLVEPWDGGQWEGSALSHREAPGGGRGELLMKRPLPSEGSVPAALSRQLPEQSFLQMLLAVRKGTPPPISKPACHSSADPYLWAVHTQRIPLAVHIQVREEEPGAMAGVGFRAYISNHKHPFFHFIFLHSDSSIFLLPLIS